MLDTGAPYYDTYETADGKFVVTRRDRAASSTRSCSSALRMAGESFRTSTIGRVGASLRHRFAEVLPRGKTPRRVVRGCSRDPTPASRRFLSVLGGARAPSPQSRASRVRDGRRRAAAGARAALLAYAGHRAPRPARARRAGTRRPWPTGGSRTPRPSDLRRSASASCPKWFPRHEGSRPLVLPDTRNTAACGSDPPSRSRRLLRPALEILGAADQAAVDEDLRDGARPRNGTDGARADRVRQR